MPKAAWRWRESGFFFFFFFSLKKEQKDHGLGPKIKIVALSRRKIRKENEKEKGKKCLKKKNITSEEAGRGRAGLLMAQLKVRAAEDTLVSWAHHSCFLFGVHFLGGFLNHLVPAAASCLPWLGCGDCVQIGRQGGRAPGEQPQ